MIIKKKTWPKIYADIASGKKKFDLRMNDFEVNEGDMVIFEEYDPETKSYTGRKIEKGVSFVLKFKLNDFGQQKEIEDKGLVVIQME